MEERRRLTLEEIDERHPKLIPALRDASARRLAARPLVRARARRRSARGGARYLADGRVEGEDPLAAFSPNAAQHLLRTDGFAHVADIMVGSFYDPALDRGLRVRGADLVPRRHRRPADAAFILHPADLPLPDEPLIGAAAVHEMLLGWRRQPERRGLAPLPSPHRTRDFSRQNGDRRPGSRPGRRRRRAPHQQALPRPGRRGRTARREARARTRRLHRLVVDRRGVRGRTDEAPPGAGRRSSFSPSRRRARRRRTRSRSLALLLERGIGAAVVVCTPLHLARTSLFFGRLYRANGLAVSFRVARIRPSVRAARVGAQCAATRPVPAPLRARRSRAGGAGERHRRLHSGVERRAEPAGGPRIAARDAARRRRARRRRRLDRSNRRRRARARRRGALAGREQGPPRRDRRGLSLGARPRVRVLRAGRRRRPASGRRARPAARTRPLRPVRRRRRIAIRLRRRLRRVPVQAESGAPLRHRRAAARDGARPAPPVRRRDERSVRGECEGAAVSRQPYTSRAPEVEGSCAWPMPAFASRKCR